MDTLFPTTSTSVLLKRVALACGALTAGIGVLVLVSWTEQNRSQTSFLVNYIPTAPNTALLFVLLGCALCIRVAWPDKRFMRFSTFAAVAFCSVIAFATLVALLLGDGLHVDHWIFSHGSDTFDTLPIGQMSPVTACYFLLCCAALLCLEFKANSSAAFLSTLVLLTGFTSALGYGYGSPLLYGKNIIPMALPTALAFVVLGVGLVSAAGPAVWPLNSLLGNSIRARLLRWFLPIFFFLMMFRNWLNVLMFGQVGPAHVLLDAALLLVVCVFISQVSKLVGGILDRAEQNVRASEALFRSVYENAGFGLTVRNTSGRLLRANPFWCKMLGYTEDELKKLSVRNMTFAEDIEQSEAAMQRLLVGLSQCEELEKRYVRKDGQLIWCHTSLALIRDERGLPLQFVAQAHDITLRKRIEVALFKSEQKYRALFENSKDAIFLMTEQRFIDCNSATVEMFRLSHKEDIIGTHPSVYSPPFQPNGQDSMSAAVEKITEAFTKGYACFEWMHRRKDGEDFPVEVILNVIAYDGEKILQATVRDFSERKRAEVALRKSQGQLQESQRIAHLGSWKLDVATGQVTWSEELYNMFGMDPKLPPPNYNVQASHYTPESWKHLTTSLSLTQETGIPYEIELELVRPDGSHRWIWARGEVIRDAKDVVVGLHGVALDIHDRKKAEEECRLSVAYNRSLIEASMDPLVTIDLSGKITDVNKATMLATGAERQELIGTNFAKYFLNPEKARSGYEQVFQKGLVRDYELELRHKDGHITPVLYNAVLYRNEAGKVMGVFAAARDISERKHIENELKEAARRKDDFLAMLGHELRNPLAPIRNAAQILKMIGMPNPSAEKARDMVERQTNHLSHIVDDLLDVSRISRGKVILHSERLDLAKLVRDNVEDTRTGIEARGIKLKLEVPSEPLWVHGDVTRLAQVLSNLLVNAQKFSESSGTITVTLLVNSQTHQAELSVQDIGMGISAEVMAHLFEPFVQAEMDLARKRGGLGLGLALSKGLVELHGGKIRVESKGLKQGTTVTVCLPTLAETVAKPVALAVPVAPAQSVKAPARQKRVLVIEDNIDAAESLQLLLGLFGYNSELAFDGRAGLKKVHSFAPDIILCDIGLPGGMDGYEVAREIRKDPALIKTYLIAMTGYGQDEDKRMAREAGFNEHFTKPTDPMILEKMLKTVHGAPSPSPLIVSCGGVD